MSDTYDEFSHVPDARDRTILRQAADNARLRAREAELVKALTTIRDICRRPDWTDTYTDSELNSDWREIWNTARQALANINKTEGE